MGLDEKFIQAGMFNQRSDESDRQKKLSEILRKKHFYEEVKDDIPDDDTINEMIQRSQEEFELFTKMDLERYEIEKEVYPHF